MEDYAEVALYLAKYHADNFEWREAEKFAKKLMEDGGPVITLQICQ